jgi:Cu/Ag efflux pump CusA
MHGVLQRQGGPLSSARAHGMRGVADKNHAILVPSREGWRPGMTYEKLTQEMDGKLQLPGLTNTGTMPVENRRALSIQRLEGSRPRFAADVGPMQMP